MPLVWDITLAGLALAFSYFLYSRGQTAPDTLPPGPPKDILIGHARRIPFYKGWEVYAKWKELYGDVIYTQAFGRSVVVLNSITSARDLLEKKSSIFSDRPYLPVLYEMGFELILPLLRYGPRFRKHRRMFHQYFSPQAIKAFRPTQERELLKFLRHLLTNPDNFITHIHNFVSGTIISVTYGHDVVTENDPFVELVETALRFPVSTGNIGTTLLDVFPFMRYAPAWFPGMGVKRLIPKGRELAGHIMTQPLEELKAKRDKGNAPQCLMNELLDRYEEMHSIDPEHERDIMNIGTSIYSAGSDTTKTALKMFFLLMTIYPEVAMKAQKEIDRVIGRVRLPCIADRENLPYLSCILKEMYRIQPPVPLGIPHRSIQAEQYRGWTIPEGTMAVANIWLMMRDEKVFPNPDIFLPERHMKKVTSDLNKVALAEVPVDSTSFVAEDDPSSIVFGFGRRACPGKYFADTILWETVANVLALFDIKPYTNPKTGKIEVPNFEFDSDGIIAYPKPFKCAVTPRDANWAENITMNV